MATLDDKILGEKLEYYCSSDEEDNGDSDNDECVEENSKNNVDEVPSALNPVMQNDGTSNTGPKGVIKDWQRYRQLEAEKRAEQDLERIALAQKLSLTCRTAQEDEEDDPDLAELLSDEFILEYSRQRMQEMITKSTTNSQFGRVINLYSGQEYLDAIDKEDRNTTVIVHVFDDKNVSCRTMNDCLNELAILHSKIKFCTISATIAGLSQNFKKDGVPALLVYKNGELVGNFIQLSQVLGDDYTVNDVDNFLLENNIILDSPEILKGIR